MRLKCESFFSFLRHLNILQTITASDLNIFFDVLSIPFHPNLHNLHRKKTQITLNIHNAITRFSTRECILSREGISKQLDYPKMSDFELSLLNVGMTHLEKSLCTSLVYYDSLWANVDSCRFGMRKHFHHPPWIYRPGDCKFWVSN